MFWLSAEKMKNEKMKKRKIIHYFRCKKLFFSPEFVIHYIKGAHLYFKNGKRYCITEMVLSSGGRGNEKDVDKIPTDFNSKRHIRRTLFPSSVGAWGLIRTCPVKNSKWLGFCVTIHTADNGSESDIYVGICSQWKWGTWTPTTMRALSSLWSRSSCG